jgi:hypothetical protein
LPRGAVEDGQRGGSHLRGLPREAHAERAEALELPGDVVHDERRERDAVGTSASLPANPLVKMAI